MNARYSAISLGLLTAVSLCGWLTGAAAAGAQPVELGQVQWHRDLPGALPIAREQDKPIFVLFQEVPGCLTCQTYGHKVLSHPLVVEAIETLFVPVVIFNNRGGSDAAALDKFGEPPWNNPVVRMIGADEKDLVPRLSADYTTAGLVERMVQALRAAGQEVPGYLELLDAEQQARARGTESAVFGMFCFWTGEKVLGRYDGVVATRPGFMQGREAVEVVYDPSVVNFAELVKHAHRYRAGDQVFARSGAQQTAAAGVIGNKAFRSDQSLRLDSEPKYYLAHTPLKYLPMTELQVSRVNAAVGDRKDVSSFLSPRQLRLLKLIHDHPDAGWSDMIGRTDLTQAWQDTITTAAGLTD